jgi:hypothetical protein
MTYLVTLKVYVNQIDTVQSIRKGLSKLTYLFYHTFVSKSEALSAKS